MLFLQHLRSIDFFIIDEAGSIEKIACCTVPISALLAEGVYKQVVSVQRGEASASEEEWLVVQCSSPEDALNLLFNRTGSASEKVLKKHKLRADVGLAFPLNSIGPDAGQLFTFLRLPIKTGFPAHIHSLFSLTPSRQNLRPHGENGIVKGSDD
jgi:sacsin